MGIEQFPLPPISTCKLVVLNLRLCGSTTVAGCRVMQWHGPAWCLKSRVQRSRLQSPRVRDLPQPEKMASSSESEVEWRMEGKDNPGAGVGTVSTDALSSSGDGGSLSYQT